MSVVSLPGPSAHTPSPHPSNAYGSPNHEPAQGAEALLCDQMSSLSIAPSFQDRFPPFSEHAFTLLRKTLAKPDRDVPIKEEVLQTNADKIVEFIKNNWFFLVGKACQEKGSLASFPKSVTELPYTLRGRVSQPDEVTFLISFGQCEEGCSKIIKGIISFQKSSVEKLAQLGTRKWTKTSPHEARKRRSEEEIRKGSEKLQKEINLMCQLSSNGVPNLPTYLVIHYKSKDKKLQTRYVTEWSPCDLYKALTGSVLPSVDKRLRMAKSIAITLEKIHELGIVHLDLKPENVLLAEDGSIRLTDFEFAKEINATVTPPGSPGYFAPEVIEFPDYVTSPTADMWSYGSLLCTLFYLYNIFYSDHIDYLDRIIGVEQIKQKIRKTIFEIKKYGSPQFAQSTCPTLPIPIRHLIPELLSEDPKERKTSFQVREVFQALE
jgi:hypothetical protein